MDNGFAIILAQTQHNISIGMGLASAHVSVHFFQKLKEAQPENSVTILAQLTNLPIGIILVSLLAIFLLSPIQRGVLPDNFVGIYVRQVNFFIGMGHASMNVIFRFPQE